MPKRDSYIYYRSFEEALTSLPEKDELLLRRSISNYSLDFKEPKVKGLAKTIWTLIRPQLNANNKRFMNGQKGAEHGQKGGRPKTPKKPLDNPKETPSLTPNKNKNVNKNNNNNVNYIHIDEEKVFDLCKWFHETRGIWANDFPKRNKFSLEEKCNAFMLDKSEHIFNDANHVQNSFVLWVGKEKGERKGSGEKKEDRVTAAARQAWEISQIKEDESNR